MGTDCHSRVKVSALVVDKGPSPESGVPAHRLHLGVSRLDKLPLEVARTFSDPTWLNLGDAASANTLDVLQRVRSQARNHGWVSVPAGILKSLVALVATSREVASGARVAPVHFSVWVYEKDDRLDFADNSFTFIFSEHFFEHLFFDEAAALLRECERVLKPGGIIRTVVPDADLRTDSPPEPIGFPSPRVGWNEPAKHKTRWSAYMLAELKELTRLLTIKVRYYDKKGHLNALSPMEILEAYAELGGDGERKPIEVDLATSLSYIRRRNSLIVDGIKR